MEKTLVLTQEEERMLAGDYGKMKQKALEVIVRYANVLGAERLCDVSKAHLFCGAHAFMEVFKSEDPDAVISEMLFCSPEKFTMDRYACPYSQSDVTSMDPERWDKMGITAEQAGKNEDYLGRFSRAGIHLTGSCVPYLLGFVPLMGEHYVTTESHAVLMMNSLWGACANADGVEIAFSAAACGKIPLWGNHIMENRRGTHVFHVECPTGTTCDWDLLGYTIGRMLPTHSVPVLVGTSRPDVFKLKAFFASLATTAGPEMCHIVGITPEAPTLESALGGVSPVGEAVVRSTDISESHSLLSDSGGGEIQYVSLGCPHYAINEIEEVARFLRGRKVREGVTLQVWTAAQIKHTADRCGYTADIEEAGGTVLTSTCPMTSERIPPGLSAMAFDSAKQAHYIRPMKEVAGRKIYYGSMMDCLEAALTGKWGGRRG